MDNKSIAQSWLEQAADDLRWCQSGVDGEVWHGACFSAQQVAEKSFKALDYTEEKARKALDQATSIHHFVTKRLSSSKL